MDELLYECFRCAVKHKVTKSELPLLTSTFYSKHLLPCWYVQEKKKLLARERKHRKKETFDRSFTFFSLAEDEVGTYGVVYVSSS